VRTQKYYASEFVAVDAMLWRCDSKKQGARRGSSWLPKLARFRQVFWKARTFKFCAYIDACYFGEQ